MFDFSWSELLLIGIVALVFIGPKELPGVLRTLGQWMGKVRRMAAEFQNQFHDAMREAELADLKKEVEEMTAHAANIDPLADVRKDMESARREIETAAAYPSASGTAPAAVTSPAEASHTEDSPVQASAVQGAPPADAAASAPTSPAAPVAGEPRQEPAEAGKPSGAGSEAG